MMVGHSMKLESWFKCHFPKKLYTYKSLLRLTSSRQTCALCRTLKGGGNFAPLPFLFPKNLASQFFSGTLKKRTTKTSRVQNRKLRQERSFSVHKTYALNGQCPVRPPQNSYPQKGTVPLVTLSWYRKNFITITCLLYTSDAADD